LKSLHEVVVRNRLEQLRKRQRDEALQAQEELLAGVAKSASGKYGTDVPAVEIEAVQEEVVPVDEIEPYDRSMSPGLLDITKLHAEERQIDILTEEEDRRALVSSIRFSILPSISWLISNSQFEQRRAVTASRFVPKVAQPVTEVQDPEAASGADLASEALYRQEAERDLDEEEELFNLEENIVNPTTYNWEDKYRPRKPRYFNRVHTGYEWNKYNQTHYEWVCSPSCVVIGTDVCVISTDNPPPKVVQGYKVRSYGLCHVLSPELTSWCSLMSSTRTSSINQKRQRTRLSRSRETTRPYFYTSALVLHTRISLSESSIVNGNSRINGALLESLPRSAMSILTSIA
jgi:hypothetical protein